VHECRSNVLAASPAWAHLHPAMTREAVRFCYREVDLAR
jgi:hypothetical protein